MNKKSFIFGLGVGFISLSIVFYLAKFIEHRITSSRILVESTVSPTVTPSPTITPAPTVTPIAIPTQPPEPIIKIEKEALSDDEIIQKAISLGMTFAEVEAPDMTEVPTETEAPKKTETPIEISRNETSITLRIPPGSTAISIAELLKQYGVIEDAERFNSYVAENLATRRLMAGEFVFPFNADYNAILNVLLRNKR